VSFFAKTVQLELELSRELVDEPLVARENNARFVADSLDQSLHDALSGEMTKASF
jgi:hypothetical protein